LLAKSETSELCETPENLSSRAITVTTMVMNMKLLSRPRLDFIPAIAMGMLRNHPRVRLKQSP